ncbi:hypothetical protein VTI74DRAFT_2889 [Chaetomium olivicolor]
MARRSARIASLTKAKQASEASTLSSVAERESSTDNAALENTTNAPAALSPVREPKTPGGSSPAKPPMSEMHPSKVHPTMGPPSSGLRLGFTDIKPTANRDDGLPAAAQTTPSRITVPASDFTFRFTRQTPVSDLGLGPEAQRMMDELRGEAAKIKAELRAKQDSEKLEEEKTGGRKIAQAKGKAGRFSAVHMAEFKKMDSIENHPSAFRYQPGRITPLKAGVKRSQSKANLDEPESLKQPTPATTAKSKQPAAAEEPAATAKRARQHIDEDASSKRPVSRDGSSIPMPKSAGPAVPRPKSNLASLMTPTKAALARSISVKTPSQGLLARSPSKATLSGIPRSAATNNPSTANLAAEEEPAPSAEVQSPRSRFNRVKAMLRGAKSSASKTKSGLPQPSTLVSRTPAPARLQKEGPPVPMTTPGRKLTKHVAFTPETQRAAMTQNSPSPVKSSLPQPKGRQILGEVHYPSLDVVIAEGSTDTGVSYPTLPAVRPLPEPPVKTFKATSATTEPSAPGEFTFRSDHTISFGGATTASFGSSPGQASVRAVRPSILPTESMPGSFPRSTTPAISTTSTSSPNKENDPPRSVFLALPHGMSTKKRHRVSTDEEEAEQEAAERAAKKRKGEAVPEGEALLAPRLVASARKIGGVGNRSVSPKKGMGSMSAGGQGTPSPLKKKTGAISLSRLNMLARPKMRK